MMFLHTLTTHIQSTHLHTTSIYKVYTIQINRCMSSSDGHVLGARDILSTGFYADVFLKFEISSLPFTLLHGVLILEKKIALSKKFHRRASSLLQEIKLEYSSTTTSIFYSALNSYGNTFQFPNGVGIASKF